MNIIREMSATAFPKTFWPFDRPPWREFPRKGEAASPERSLQAEGGFGVLKQDFGFRRFLRRGQNPSGLFLLPSFAYFLLFSTS